MNTYRLFDDEFKGLKRTAKSFRAAIRLYRDELRIKGRLRCVAYCGNAKTYKLDNSDYTIMIEEN